MSRPEAGPSGRVATADSRVAPRRRRRRSAAGNRTLDVRRHYRARRRTSAAAPQLRGPVRRILVAERPESGPRSWEERLSRPLPPLLDAAVRALAGAGPFAPRTRRGKGARRSSSASRGVRATPRKERPPRPPPPLLDAALFAPPTSPARPRAHNQPPTHTKRPADAGRSRSGEEMYVVVAQRSICGRRGEGDQPPAKRCTTMALPGVDPDSRSAFEREHCAGF